MLLPVATRRQLDRTAAEPEFEIAGALALPAARIGPAWCIAHGPGRYINRALGIGATPVTGAELDAIERFFDVSGLPPALEVSSRAAPDLVAELAKRRYGPRWFRSVYVLELEPERWPMQTPKLEIRRVDGDLLRAWHQVRVAGFGLCTAAEQAWDRRFAEASRACGSLDFVVLEGQRAVGCGGLRIAEGLAWLGAAATAPDRRRRGVQSALLGHRIALGAAQGCSFAAATATSGGASARNLERHGFSLVDVQLVMAR